MIRIRLNILFVFFRAVLLRVALLRSFLLRAFLLRTALFLAALFPPAPSFSQGLIIPSGAYVIGNTGNIVLQNNWVNNGSFTHNDGTLIFSGTTQTLGGSVPSVFNNITVSTGSNTTIITAGQQLRGILTSNATLNSNGNLTLLSTAAATASVSGSGTGNVLGNLTMQRYLPSGFGYKYFSSPFKADTVGDFSTEINLNTSFPDFYRNDENQLTNGWITYTNPSGLLVPLQGYTVNFGTSTAPLTVSLTGVVSNGIVTAPTLTNHNFIYTQGFNLVGNPYPSPIDWNSSTGWTKTNIDNALYFFRAGTTDQYTGTYSTYINGVSSDGTASNIIPAMQGFFIHVTNGSFPVTGQLVVNNNARNNNPSVIFLGNGGAPEGPPPLLRLRAGYNDTDTLSDPLVIYFKNNATTGFDNKLDALKLMNTHPAVPSLYAIASDTARLSIQALPNLEDQLQIIPLGLSAPQDGYITFRLADIQQTPSHTRLYLTDTKAGIDQDLSQSPRYRLYLAKGDYKNRFFLKFSPTALTPATPPVTQPFDAYDAGGRLMIKSNLTTDTKANLLIFDAAGHIVYRQQLTDNNWHSFDISSFPAAVYVLSLGNEQETHAKKLFIGKER